MKKSKFQISLLAVLHVTSIIAVAIAFWMNRVHSIRMSRLETQMGNIESDYLKRSRLISLIGNLDVENEIDLKTLRLVKAFAQHLSQTEKLGKEKVPNVAAAGKHSELIDLDNEGGTLEILLLKTTLKLSPGWDISVIGLYDDENFVAALPIETYARTWHDIIVSDKNHDGIDDITIQEYKPGDPSAKRPLTNESIYYVSKNGFSDTPIQYTE